MSHWEQPTNGRKTGLKLSNSLTNSIDEFIPSNGNHVSWYICGPTVYDSSHIGHARNYMTFDIIRRIMVDYFRYDVLYVMNITDIDDKIIIKSHQRHLEELIRFITKQESAKEFVKNHTDGEEGLIYKANILIASKRPTISEVSSLAAEIKEEVKKAGNDLFLTIKVFITM